MSAERVFELARHLTERDREIALVLYEQQVLTTDQLQLLFFSSRRRAQDRLLFLYRHRVVDRFYPPLPLGAGKAQAHWLLDEAGAILVAAMLGLERKQLGWRRRDDWGSHPQPGGASATASPGAPTHLPRRSAVARVRTLRGLLDRRVGAVLVAAAGAGSPAHAGARGSRAPSSAPICTAARPAEAGDRAQRRRTTKPRNDLPS